jgi:hypothetical protein
MSSSLNTTSIPSNIQRGLWTALLLLASLHTLAASLSHELSRGDKESIGEDGGYFELGAGIGFGTTPLVDDTDYGIAKNFALTLAGGYRYHGWFVEANDNENDGVSLGYTFSQSPQWLFDFTVTVLDKSQGDGEDYEYSELEETKRDQWLMYRDRTYVGYGLRTTGYWDNRFLQFRLLDGFEKRGIYISLRIGQTWQVRNWNFHAIAGLEYYSDKTADLIIGVIQHD